ncbi:hypothetical protein LCGC14_0467380 [marine sediment metagenome]|uniref:Uncharacterized protein n=1 Tax=marine sediment metagenome TaxID=412755 RepID=A0A0F9SDD6_9ZZZZ
MRFQSICLHDGQLIYNDYLSQNFGTELASIQAESEGANMAKSITVRFHEAGRKFYFTDKGMEARSSRNGIEKAHMLFEAVEAVTGRQYHFGTKRFKAFARGFNGACSHDGERTIYA